LLLHFFVLLFFLFHCTNYTYVMFTICILTFVFCHCYFTHYSGPPAAPAPLAPAPAAPAQAQVQGNIVHHGNDVSNNVINAQGHVIASSNNISNAAQSPSSAPAPLEPLAQAAAEHEGVNSNGNSSQDAPFVAPQQQPWWAVGAKQYKSSARPYTSSSAG
jgi:hypothetical protein